MLDSLDLPELALPETPRGDTLALSVAVAGLAARGAALAEITERLAVSGPELAVLFVDAFLAEEERGAELYEGLAHLDLEGLDLVDALRSRLVDAQDHGAALDAMEAELIRQVSELPGESDAFGTWPAHLDLAGRFAALVEPSEASSDEALRDARLRARLAAIALDLRDDYPSAGLALVRAEPPMLVCRALARDTRLLSRERWLSALLFHGDVNGRALGTASLLFAERPALDKVRYTAALAPIEELGRLAEAYGLLTLLGSRGEAARAVTRGALLVHVFCGERLSGIPWWRLFRGEAALADSLAELGVSRDALARDLASGLPHRLADRGLRDPGVRDALAQVLADVLSRDPSYSAAMRLCEAQLRDPGAEPADPDAMAEGHRTDAVRDYAWLLVGAARRLLEYGKRPTADLLYRRVVKLRQDFPGVLVPDLFPDRLEKALDGGHASGLARRLRLEDEAPEATPLAPGVRRASPEDPLPDTTDIVAAVTGLEPLPLATAVWVDAVRWTPARLLDAAVPLPLRRLATRALRLVGCTPRARLVLAASGAGALDVTWRLFGVPIGREQVTLPAHRVFVFPTESPRADGLLGRWAAILLALSTIGTWLFLRAADDFGRILGGSLVGGALLAYAGALSLHRVVGQGRAMALFDSRGRTSVWSLRPEDRALLVQYAERAETLKVAELSSNTG